jgi:hypothetical protein
MLHRGLAIHDATRSYWVGFLEARREFLEAIISRSDSAPEGIRDELREAVQQSIKCLLTIKPEVCEQYIQLWRKDLAAWKWRAGGISAAASVEEALSVLRLEPAQSTSGTGWLPSAGSAEPLEVRAGAVAVPWFGTMEKLPTEVGATPRRSSSAAEVGTDTVPFPVVTGTFAPEEQAARASDVDLVGGRQRKQRIGDRVNRLVTPLRRRRAPAHLMPEENPEQTEPGGVAEAAASTVAAPE